MDRLIRILEGGPIPGRLAAFYALAVAAGPGLIFALVWARVLQDAGLGGLVVLLVLPTVLTVVVAFVADTGVAHAFGGALVSLATTGGSFAALVILTFRAGGFS